MHKMPRAFTFGDALRALWRNIILVVALTVLGGAGAYYIAKGMPANYSATAQMISDAGRSGLVTVNEATIDEGDEGAATTTVVESIGAPIVLNHALDRMPPEVAGLLAAAAENPKAPAKTDEERRQNILRKLSQNLEVSNSGRSFLVKLRFNAENPVLAAGAANAVADGYLAYRQEMRNEIYGKMLENLQHQITELTNDLEQAEQTAQTMRERARLLGQRSDTWVEGQQAEAIAENAAIYAAQREAEREVVMAEYEDKVGTVVNGTVARVEPRVVRVELGKDMGIIPQSEQIQGEFYSTGSRIKVLIKDIERDNRGPQLILSRGNEAFIDYLFRQEVPELETEAVSIKGIAREAGRRTKIAVASNVPGVDPVGTFVGGHGVRVNAV
ncbi:MAG: S1 RNA-binding domain-containing protein, partial [Hyphomicrobiaceae bacterium]